MINLAIFASGSGSNAEEIIRHFQNKKDIAVKLILSNNAQSYVLKRAEKYDIPSIVFSRADFFDSENVLDRLIENDIDFIILAGFLWLIPQNLINRYEDRIVNIHPALLPSFGGKGMYGNKVHQAVIDAKVEKTGITIHFVNEKYDEGNIIYQAQCPVYADDTVETVQQRVHSLEHKYFPMIIEKIVRETFKK